MSTTTTTTIMKRPITKYLVGSAAGLLLLGVAALSGLTGGAQAGTQPTAGVLVRAGMPQVDTRVDTRLTLVTNSRVTYSEPTGGQTTYQVSYGDGASGDLFVSTTDTEDHARNLLAVYFANADTPVEGGTLSTTDQGTAWMVAEQGGALCRESTGVVRRNLVLDLTVFANDCRSADAHTLEWATVLGAHGLPRLP